MERYYKNIDNLDKLGQEFLKELIKLPGSNSYKNSKVKLVKEVDKDLTYVDVEVNGESGNFEISGSFNPSNRGYDSEIELNLVEIYTDNGLLNFFEVSRQSGQFEGIRALWDFISYKDGGKNLSKDNKEVVRDKVESWLLQLPNALPKDDIFTRFMHERDTSKGKLYTFKTLVVHMEYQHVQLISQVLLKEDGAMGGIKLFIFKETKSSGDEISVKSNECWKKFRELTGYESDDEGYEDFNVDEFEEINNKVTAVQSVIKENNSPNGLKKLQRLYKYLTKAGISCRLVDNNDYGKMLEFKLNDDTHYLVSSEAMVNLKNNENILKKDELLGNEALYNYLYNNLIKSNLKSNKNVLTACLYIVEMSKYSFDLRKSELTDNQAKDIYDNLRQKVESKK